MMKPRVYVETTVISYLTSWPSRDVVVAGHQQLTRDWWKASRDRFEVLASELVVKEAGAGDERASRDRLELLDGVQLLEAPAAAWHWLHT
jgi:hypothetical protein